MGDMASIPAVTQALASAFSVRNVSLGFHFNCHFWGTDTMSPGIRNWCYSNQSQSAVALVQTVRLKKLKSAFPSIPYMEETTMRIWRLFQACYYEVYLCQSNQRVVLFPNYLISALFTRKAHWFQLRLPIVDIEIKRTDF